MKSFFHNLTNKNKDLFWGVLLLALFFFYFCPPMLAYAQTATPTDTPQPTPTPTIDIFDNSYLTVYPTPVYTDIATNSAQAEGMNNTGNVLFNGLVVICFALGISQGFKTFEG